MDMEFDRVAELLGNIEVNIRAAREHMGEVERMYQNVNQRGRGFDNALPCSYLPAHMIIHLVHFIVMWLNELTAGRGIY